MYIYGLSVFIRGNPKLKQAKKLSIRRKCDKRNGGIFT